MNLTDPQGRHPGTVGQMVLYTNLGDAAGEYPPEQQPALITRCNDDGTCALTIFYPTGQFLMTDVAYAPTFARRHWTPIERAL